MLALLLTLAAAAVPPTVPCYTLGDAEKAQRAHTRTFSIPRSDQRRDLAVGQNVKLVFEPCGGSTGALDERMWVVVTAKTASGYTGRLDNAPAGDFGGLSAGASVAFEPRHVIAMEQVDPSLVLPWGKSAFVSRAIVEADAWPAFATRGTPAHAEHSGWIVFSAAGLEEDVGTMVEVSVDQLIAKFQVLDSILDEPADSSWRWDASAVEYVRLP